PPRSRRTQPRASHTTSPSGVTPMVEPPQPMLTPSIEDLARELRKAWQAGRTIVPIVGAGLSADSGFPVINSVVRYFGKLHQYIAHRVSLPPPPEATGTGQEGDPLAERAGLYRTRPWRFIEDFGWPDRFQLNQELLARFTPNPEQFGLRGPEGNLV